MSAKQFKQLNLFLRLDYFVDNYEEQDRKYNEEILEEIRKHIQELYHSELSVRHNHPRKDTIQTELLYRLRQAVKKFPNLEDTQLLDKLEEVIYYLMVVNSLYEHLEKEE